MGPKIWKTAVLVAAVIAAASCTAPPPPVLNDPLVVNVTADTFDGVCDADCSFRDAIAASNALPLASGVPNRITLPTATIVLSATAPIQITRQVIVTGSNAELTTLDVTGSTVAAPEGIFDAVVPLILNGVGVVSTAAPATQVLASCDPLAARAVSLFNVTTSGLAATTSRCDTTLVNSVITGTTAALAPKSFAATSSTVPFSSTPISPLRFTLVSATVTGPSAADGSTQDAVLDLQAPGGATNIPVDITGSRLVGIGVRLGGTDPGTLRGTFISSSFGMNGPTAPAAISVGAGSTLRMVNSTVYGGGPAGALQLAGALTAEAATITTNGPSIVLGAGGSASLRRSIVSAGSGSACSAAVTSLGHNVVAGTSCGTTEATDVTVANEAALQLGVLDRWGNPTPSLHRLPAATSPVVDIVAPGPVSDLDCPVEGTEGRSIDARGVRRPQGTGCDAGSLELEVVAP